MKAQMKWSAFTLCVAATVLALVWFASAVADLSGGLGDTFRHWWAALPAGVLAVAATATIASDPEPARPSAPDSPAD